MGKVKFFGDRMEKYYTKYCPKCHSKNVNNDIRNPYGDITFQCNDCGFQYQLDHKSWGKKRELGHRDEYPIIS
jgi:transposase-like protein